MAVTVATLGPIDKHSVHVTLGGSYAGSYTYIHEKWIYYYSINQVNITPYLIRVQVGYGPGTPFTILQHRTPGVTYYYRAMVWWEQYNHGYAAWGERVEFKMGLAITANALGATNIEGSNARLNGSFTRDDEDISVVRFRYWKLQTPGTVISVIKCNLPGSPPNYCSLYGPTFFHDLNNLVPEVWYAYQVGISCLGVPEVLSNISTFYTGLLELNFRAYADTPSGRVYGQNMVVPL